MDVVQLSLTNLRCGYGSFTIPSYSINQTIIKPTLVAVLGKNGSGKSTLLRTIAGLQKPLEGNISIQNQNIKKLKVKQRACFVSYMPSFNPKIHFITTEEYVKLGWYPHSNKALEHEKMEQVLTDLDLIEKRNHFLNQLSDGEMQRAAIARNIIQDSPIMIFDEANSHLDPKHQQKIFEIFYRLVNEQQKIVLFSTHMAKESLHYAHKIWLLAEDQLISKIPEQIIIDKDLENNQLSFNLPQFKLVQTKHKIHIRLIGDGIPFQYTRYAFLRYGIETVCNKQCAFSVIIQQNPNARFIWLVKKEGIVIKEFLDLSELIEFLLIN
ncbi:MAG: ABC transporter ATP-binding protein [Bacteroidales bacterium]|jgi:iron complex transport system ATP-binding protein|nr:ABC transporter ATP-binding protein [Bacteroidales bacterium]